LFQVEITIRVFINPQELISKGFIFKAHRNIVCIQPNTRFWLHPLLKNNPTDEENIADALIRSEKHIEKRIDAYRKANY